MIDVDGEVPPHWTIRSRNVDAFKSRQRYLLVLSKVYRNMAIQPTMSDPSPPQAGPSSPRAPYVAAQTLNTHTRSVTALTYSSDGRTLVSGGADGWVHLWYVLAS